MPFRAGLELTRRRMLFLRQTRPFSELWIYRREDARLDQLEQGRPREGEEPPEDHQTNDQGVDA